MALPNVVFGQQLVLKNVLHDMEGDTSIINPTSIRVTSSGDIAIGSSGQIKVFEASGKLKYKFGSYGRGNGQFGHVTYFTDLQNGRWLIVDSYYRVLIYDIGSHSTLGLDVNRDGYIGDIRGLYTLPNGRFGVVGSSRKVEFDSDLQQINSQPVIINWNGLLSVGVTTRGDYISANRNGTTITYTVSDGTTWSDESVFAYGGAIFNLTSDDSYVYVLTGYLYSWGYSLRLYSRTTGQFIKEIQSQVDIQFLGIWGNQCYCINGNREVGKVNIAAGEIVKVFDGKSQLSLLQNFMVTDDKIMTVESARFKSYTKLGQPISTWSGNGTGSGQIYPTRESGLIQLNSGSYLFSDTGNNRLQVWSIDGVLESTYGSIGTDTNQFRNPTSIARVDSQKLVIADTGNYRIKLISENGDYLSSFQTRIDSTGPFLYPNYVTVVNGEIWVLYGSVVYRYSQQGSYIGTISVPEMYTPGGGFAASLHNTAYLGVRYGILEISSDGKTMKFLPTRNYTETAYAIQQIFVDYLDQLWIFDQSLSVYEYITDDRSAPTSTHSLSPSPTEFGWTRAATTLTITSTDKAPSVGFKEFHYTVDSGAEQVTTETTKSLSFDDGIHQIAYWGVDNAGNIETTQYATVRIDKIRPVTTRTVNATDTLLTLTPTDNASGIAGTFYSIDGAPQQLYSAPITLDGKQHRIVYWSVDKAGNVEYVNTTLIGVALRSITLDRTTAVGGFTRTGRINLTGPAPAGGVDVLVWSDNVAASVPVSVNVPVGQSSATFEITTLPVSANTTVTLSATAGDNTRYAQLDLIPPSARISATPRSVVGGAVVTFAVTLDGPAPAGGTVVSLSSDNADVLPVPETVTIAEGQTSASVQVTSVPMQERSTVIVSASTAAQSATATVLVDAPSPASVTLAPTAVNGGTGAVGTVTLNGPAPAGGYEVALASNSATATVPASIMIAAGQTTGTFDIATRGVQQNTTVNITATANNVRRVAVLTVRSAAVASVRVTPSTVLGSQGAVGRVNLTTPAPDGGLVVDLTSSNTNVIFPATVRVAAGETAATFDVQTKSVTAQTVATITATFNGASKTTTLTVNALVLQNLTVSAASVTGGTGLTATVTLSAPAPTGGVAVALSSNNAAVSVPTTFTVAAGQITATVDITTVAVTINTNVTLTATLLGVSKTSTVTVTAPGLTRLMLNPSSVVGGNTSTATIDIASPAPAGGLVITLSSNCSDVLAPATVTVSAGQTSVSVQVPTRTVLSQVDAVITATLNGVSRTANLSLTAPALTSIALNPSTVRGGEDATLTVQLTSVAPTGGVTVVLASTNSALVVPASVTVPTGETTVKVTLATRAVTATENGQLTATFAGVSKSVQVSVLAPVMASLTIEPNAVVGGSSATGTLELSSIAPSGGLVVSLSSNKSDVLVPATITIPAGSTTVSFAVQTSKVASDVTASITVTLNGNTRTAQLRVVAHQLSTVAVSPSSVSGGTSFTGRVTLQQAAPAGGIVVALSGNDSAVSMPSTVTVDAGKTTATFAGTTAAVTVTKNVTITASLNGNSVTDSLRVVQPGIKTVSLSPSTVTGGTGSQLIITLDAPAPVGGWLINLASSDVSATIATTAMVAAGQTTVTVPVSTKSVLARTAVILTATDGSGSQATTLVVEPVVGLQLRLSSSSIAGGTSVNLTVVLAEAAPKTGATVALSADNASLVVPVSVKVLAGSKTATVVVKSLAVAVDTTVRIAGTVNGYTDRAQLVVTAPRPQAVTFTPTAVLGGKPATGTLTLTGLAPAGGLTVQLSSDNAAATVPATVLVPAGKNVATFVVTTKAVTGRTPANISASANGTTVSQQLAVQALTVQSVVLKPVTVVGGTPSIGAVTLNGVAPAGGLQVDLTSSVNGVTVPAKVFVPAGKNIVTFTAATEPVGSNVEATLTARANGDQATATLLVTPVLVSSLTVAPTTVVGGTSATGTVKLTAAPGVDTVVTLSSGNPTIASVPATVVVKKGTLTATFTVTTKKPAAQTAVTLSAVTGGAAKTVSVTVKP